jgi:beta-phosphoglucomutase-like phosphatase (HAD superfamily)
MSEPTLDLDPTVGAALEELAAAIGQHYPDARFRISRGEDDPAIVQLIAVVDLDDTDAVHDVVTERVLKLQEQGLPICVVTERPLERTIAMHEAAHATTAMPIVSP